MKILFFLLLFINIVKAEEFHKPQTEAEIALDRILVINKKNSIDLSGCFSLYNKIIITNQKIQHLEETKPDENKLKICKQFFTEELITISSKAERKSCNNSRFGYDHGCWLDINPIICAQDEDEANLYRTIDSNNNSATIESIWISDKLNDSKDITTYYMKKEGGIWKMNNNSCLITNLDHDK